MDEKHERVIEREEEKGSQTNERCVYIAAKSHNTTETYYTCSLSSWELITFQSLISKEIEIGFPRVYHSNAFKECREQFQRIFFFYLPCLSQ